MGETQPERHLTGSEWAHQEQVEMLRLGTPRIFDEHDPEGDLTMMP